MVSCMKDALKFEPLKEFSTCLTLLDSVLHSSKKKGPIPVQQNQRYGRSGGLLCTSTFLGP